MSDPVQPSILDAIGLKYGTDKSSSGHNYLEFYEERLSKLRDSSFVFVEIGVQHGHSLNTWGAYFPQATIVGIDVDVETVRYAGGNRHVYIGDASRGEVVDDVVGGYGRPTIVLDDGSHIWHEQIEAFRYFWPKILPGGLYIMEDLHTSFAGMYKHVLYNNERSYIGHSDISTYDYLQKINRIVTAGGHLGDETQTDGFLNHCAGAVRSIEWYPKTCVIRKK